MLQIGIAAALSATLLWSAANLIGKRLAATMGNLKTSLIVIPVGILPLLAYLLATGGVSISAYATIAAVVSGAFLFLGFMMGYKALETEQLTKAYTLSEIQPAILVMFGIFVLGQRLTTVELAAIALIFIGGFLVITTDGFKINRRLLPAIASTIFFSAFWLLINYSIGHSSNPMMPLTIGRTIGSILVFGYFFSKTTPQKTKFKIGKGAAATLLMLALLAGLVDGAGDLSFGIALFHNFITIGSALTALAPMVVAIASYFVYKDRLTGLQLAGFLVMVVGAVALSLL